MIEDGAWVESWLSAPRFAVYLAAADGDRLRALRLYEWNAAVSAALQDDLSHLEVGLRNAYDRALCDARDDRERHWVFDADRLFPPAWQKAANGVRYDANKTTRKLLANAIRTAAGSTPQSVPAGRRPPRDRRADQAIALAPQPGRPPRATARDRPARSM